MINFAFQIVFGLREVFPDLGSLVVREISDCSFSASFIEFIIFFKLNL